MHADLQERMMGDGSIFAGLASAVRSAARRGDAVAAVADLYGRLQKQIDQRQPLCTASGRCCHFDEYGHRLYVTTIELAAFISSFNQAPAPPAAASSSRSLPQFNASDAGCRFQVGNLCGVHASRPFGCRIFYCDPTAELWQQEQYEIFHGEIKELHRRFNIPYFYVEWRDALKAIGDL